MRSHTNAGNVEISRCEVLFGLLAKAAEKLVLTRDERWGLGWSISAAREILAVNFGSADELRDVFAACG
jgi:hypothetical protein